MSVENAELRPVRVAEAIRNNLLIVAILTLAGLALGVLGASRETVQHAATTPILIQPLRGNPYYPTRTGELLTNLLTEAQAVRSNSVAELVAERLDFPGEPGTLLQGLSVTSPVNTQILDVTYRHRDEQVALTRSQAFAEAYLDYRRARATAEVETETAVLDQQIAPITAKVGELGAQLGGAAQGSAEAQILLTEISGLTEQRAQLQARRGEVAAQTTNPGQVVTPAALDGAGILNARVLLPVAGALLGLVAGVIVAMLRSRTDQALHDAADVRNLGIAVIGSIGGIDPKLDEVEASTALEDQYRKLRVAVLALEQRRPFSVVVAGAADGQHAPMAAIDLAASFARAGLDTVLIDAAELGEGPAHVLAPSEVEGLAEVLLGNTMLSTAMVPVAPMLWVLGPGKDAASMSDLLVSDEMAETLHRIKQQSDVVVIATGSIQRADAQSLASMSDAVVLEVREDVTTRPELERAIQTFEVLTCALLGAVWIGADVPTRVPGFRPETTMHRRQLRRGHTRAALAAGEATAAEAEGSFADGGEPPNPWLATAVYDPELRAWVVDAGEHADPAISADEALARKAAGNGDVAPDRQVSVKWKAHGASGAPSNDDDSGPGTTEPDGAPADASSVAARKARRRDRPDPDDQRSAAERA